MSLFKEIDREIEEIKAQKKELIKKSKKYRPSNGTEAGIFYSNWCENCKYEKGKNKCKTLDYFYLNGTVKEIRETDKHIFCTKSNLFKLEKYI